MSSIYLMFHDVTDAKCQASGFQTVGAKQYELNSCRFKSLVDSSLKNHDNVVFTFDDGGVSAFEVVAPILEKKGQKGVFFITTSKIGSTGFLSPVQIKKLHEKGHIIASHSHTHPRDISKMSYDEILSEWKESKLILEKIIGEEVSMASIPGGAISKNVIHGMEDAGYRIIYTSEPTDKERLFKSSTIKGRFTIKHNTTDAEIVTILTNSNIRKALQRRYRILRIAKLCFGSNYNRLKQAYLRLNK